MVSMRFAILFIVALATHTALAKKETKSLLNDPAQLISLYLQFFLEFLKPVFYDNPPEPLVFDNFTYSFDGLFSEGFSHISNPNVHGLSNFSRNISINIERQEIEFNLHYPFIVADGHYELNASEEFCIPGFFCEYNSYSGVGPYQHSFNEVRVQAKYTLDNSTGSIEVPSIRFTPRHFLLTFENCSLYAENYLEDGVLQTNWEERSANFTRSYVEFQPVNLILLGEATATVLSYTSRFQYKTPDVIFEELIGFGAVIVP